MVPSTNIPFFSLQRQHALIERELKEVMQRVMDRDWFVLGEELKAFEHAYALFSHTKYAAGVGSGLDALTISLRALNIGVGDEVIVPANTFIATWLAVSHVGATPVPVDADRWTGNVDVRKIEDRISTRTKAIIPVHLYGMPCEMDEILRIARSNNLFVIEDNAQAHGATFDGKPTGSFGHCNATSFYPSKILGAFGDGGAITTDEESVYERVCSFRNYGSIRKHEHEMLGANSRLDELQAAILNLKLIHVDRWSEERKRIAELYSNELLGVGDLVLPKTSARCSHAYHLFVIQTAQRNALKDFLFERGIETAIHYPTPPHLQPVYKNAGYKKGDFPVSEELAATSLSVPLWIGMRNEEIEVVIRTIKDFFE